MFETKAKKLLRQVKETYNTIAHEFSDSRGFAWGEFSYFAEYLQPSMAIVDLGCGNGRLLKYLKEKTKDWEPPAFHYYGIDNSEALLQKARKLHPGYEFIEGDQLSLPLSDQSVDLLFNIAAFHHIPTRSLQQRALREMRRVLKKRGILILTVWNLWQKKYRWPLVKAFLRSILTLGRYRPGDTFIPWGNQKLKRYYYAFRQEELVKLVHKAGFEIVDSFCTRYGSKVEVGQSFNICIIARAL